MFFIYSIALSFGCQVLKMVGIEQSVKAHCIHTMMFGFLFYVSVYDDWVEGAIYSGDSQPVRIVPDSDSIHLLCPI